MARLNEVLGGILKDVTVARFTADLQTRDLFDAYQDHPLLARLPVPRITVREVNLRLRFAIAENAEPDYGKLDLTPVVKDWTAQLQREVLPRAFAAAGKTLDAKLATQLAKEISASAKSSSLAKALAGDPATLVAASTRMITNARSRVPTKSRPTTAAIRAAAAKEVQQAVAAFIPTARRQLAATAAAEMDLQVLVRKADLADVDEGRVQEITLTLSSDDLQLAAPVPEPPPAGK